MVNKEIVFLSLLTVVTTAQSNLTMAETSDDYAVVSRNSSEEKLDDRNLADTTNFCSDLDSAEYVEETFYYGPQPSFGTDDYVAQQAS